MDPSCLDQGRISAQEALLLTHCYVTFTENKLLSTGLSPLLLIAASSGQGRLRPFCNLITHLRISASIENQFAKSNASSLNGLLQGSMDT
jgi:hypothetical protein